MTNEATVQITVRLPAEQMALLDELVGRGRYPSRAAAVRAGIDSITDAERERLIDEAIVEGYRRIPPTPEEDAWAMQSAIAAIAEEPWERS